MWESLKHSYCVQVLNSLEIFWRIWLRMSSLKLAGDHRSWTPRYLERSKLEKVNRIYKASDVFRKTTVFLCLFPASISPRCTNSHCLCFFKKTKKSWIYFIVSLYWMFLMGQPSGSSCCAVVWPVKAFSTMNKVLCVLAEFPTIRKLWAWNCFSVCFWPFWDSNTGGVAGGGNN